MENPCKTCIVKACCQIQYVNRKSYECELYERYKLWVFCNFSRNSTKLPFNYLRTKSI
jgi:hypothetical protein